MAYSSILLLAGLAAAQMTFPALLNNAEIKAFNSQDSEYQICTSVVSYLGVCEQSFVGTGTASEAPAITQCACCAGTVSLAPAMSLCSSYFTASAPALSTAASALGLLYSICNTQNSALCAATGAGSGTLPPKTTAPPVTIVSATSATASASSGSNSGAPAITSLPSATGFDAPPEACTQMVSLFTSCETVSPGFSAIPFGQQAQCYCCRTSSGQVYHTDELDQYAATCRDWASTGEPLTIYSVAKTFASFCDRFSDACNPPTQTPTSAPTTPAKTITVHATPTSSKTSSAMSIRDPSHAVGLILVVAVATLLL